MAKGNLKKESKKVSKESNPKNLPNLSAPEKTIRLLEYLKKHTDKEHSLKSVKNVQKEFNDKDLHFGSDNTIRDFTGKLPTLIIWMNTSIPFRSRSGESYMTAM